MSMHCVHVNLMFVLFFFSFPLRECQSFSFLYYFSICLEQHENTIVDQKQNDECEKYAFHLLGFFRRIISLVSFFSME